MQRSFKAYIRETHAPTTCFLQEGGESQCDKQRMPGSAAWITHLSTMHFHLISLGDISSNFLTSLLNAAVIITTDGWLVRVYLDCRSQQIAAVYVLTATSIPASWQTLKCYEVYHGFAKVKQRTCIDSSTLNIPSMFQRRCDYHR